MKKLFLLLIPLVAFAGTEPINVNTADGHVKQTSSGTGALQKPFSFCDVAVAGIPFLSLSDTPTTYVGQASKVVRVNSGETALEFATSGAGTGTVTSITATSPIVVTPSPITTTGVVSISDTAVTPGSYTSTNLTVDAKGRITAASNGGSTDISGLHYVTTQAEGSLSNEFSLGSLTTGLLKHTVSGSVSTPATATAETDYVTPTGTGTLSNKRITPRVLDTNVPSSPVTPDSDSYDFIVYRGIGAALTINAPSGTPVQGQSLVIRFKDDGTARALTWQTGSSGYFRASSDLALPTTTVLSKTLYCGFKYNSTDSRWDLLALLNNL